jgi:hypothetical protein
MPCTALHAKDRGRERGDERLLLLEVLHECDRTLDAKARAVDATGHEPRIQPRFTLLSDQLAKEAPCDRRQVVIGRQLFAQRSEHNQHAQITMMSAASVSGICARCP